MPIARPIVFRAALRSPSRMWNCAFKIQTFANVNFLCGISFSASARSKGKYSVSSVASLGSAGLVQWLSHIHLVLCRGTKKVSFPRAGRNQTMNRSSWASRISTAASGQEHICRSPWRARTPSASLQSVHRQ
ncbi:hypothetical protein KC357_g95 [Hortaea werneckii]|nr:hypothetical protein KC357_g95 [Hortaea werneckii]